MGRAASSEKCLCDASNLELEVFPAGFFLPLLGGHCSAEQALLALPTAVVKLVLDSRSADVERGL